MNAKMSIKCKGAQGCAREGTYSSIGYTEKESRSTSLLTRRPGRGIRQAEGKLWKRPDQFKRRDHHPGDEHPTGSGPQVAPGDTDGPGHISARILHLVQDPMWHPAKEARAYP